MFSVLSQVSMRKQTSELWILLSDALPLRHRDSMVSEVYYEEVYPEVSLLIPHGDSVLFLCLTLQTRQKTSFSFSMEISKGVAVCRTTQV